LGVFGNYLDKPNRRIFPPCRLDYLIDLRQPLAVLASRMPWQEIEASLAHKFSRQIRDGKQVEDIGLFGPQRTVCSAVVSRMLAAQGYRFV
jgi:hypothetical protein